MDNSSSIISHGPKIINHQPFVTSHYSNKSFANPGEMKQHRQHRQARAIDDKQRFPAVRFELGPSEPPPRTAAVGPLVKLGSYKPT